MNETSKRTCHIIFPLCGVAISTAPNATDASHPHLHKQGDAPSEVPHAGAEQGRPAVLDSGGFSRCIWPMIMGFYPGRSCTWKPPISYQWFFVYTLYILHRSFSQTSDFNIAKKHVLWLIVQNHLGNHVKLNLVCVQYTIIIFHQTVKDTRYKCSHIFHLCSTSNCIISLGAIETLSWALATRRWEYGRVNIAW